MLYLRGESLRTVPKFLKGTSNRIMKLIELKIRRFKELITGILIGSGAQWSLIRLNVVDYVLDGFQFTNKEYVAYENEIEECTMLYRILSKKNRTEGLPPVDNSTILDEKDLLYSFIKRNDILVAVCLHREDVLYVGKITDVGSKSFVLDSYDTELRKSGIMNVEFTKVRYIQMHTDYLDSLSLLLDQNQKD